MGRDEARDIRRFGWASAAFAKLVALAARVGADPLESGDAALQRLVMVLLAVGTLPLTILWSVVYLAAGAPLAAAAPAVYSLVTPINTALFAWTRNFRLYRFIQLLMTLVLPWLVTMSLGGFRNSSAVIIWAALCPVVSLLVEDLRQTVLWIVGFVLLLIVSAVLEPSLKARRAAGGVRHLVLRLEPRQRDRRSSSRCSIISSRSETSFRSGRRRCSSTSCRRKSRTR